MTSFCFLRICTRIVHRDVHVYAEFGLVQINGNKVTKGDVGGGWNKFLQSKWVFKIQVRIMVKLEV